ncbi:MAG: osmoprotectant transport system permease protein [Alcanivorax sp.]|jgi:osmoprotectant transport system permease protein
MIFPAVFITAVRLFAALLLSLLMCTANASAAATSEPIRIASKTFSESYVLAEIATQLLQGNGIAAEHKLGLGGTMIAFEALRTGAIDVYPEYTGTLIQAVLGKPNLSRSGLDEELAAMGLMLGVNLGFNNSYAVVLDAKKASTLGISRISDLDSHADLKIGFSLEFLNRGDGWPELQQVYRLPQKPMGIEHALAYSAIAKGQLDITDAYTTDGELDVYDLTILADDQGYFPRYEAGLLLRDDLSPKVVDLLLQLEQRLDEDTMRALNRRVAVDKESPASVAAEFLRDSRLVADAVSNAPTRVSRILRNTGVHLKLTSVALILACLTALPLALFFSRFERLARSLLYMTGLIQTIPALALLALLVPLVGLGQVPAILALFLYSLLPIVRNTLIGIFNVDPLLKEVATGMGLTANQKLLKVELPLAMPTIMAGVKTAAIISIGTATLAAFVGAGGLGEPIITGLTLNDHRLILEGAVPAAALAVLVELLFEWLERAKIPAHLRV